MRSKVTYLLLALNLLLFGYLVLSERPWSATRQLEENRRRVLGPEAANLAALEITAPPSAADQPAASLRLTREGDTWFLAAPLAWPANDFAVKRILNELQFLEHETSFPVSDLAANDQTLADYGLETPRLVVTATPAAIPGAVGEPPPAFTLRIGDGSAVGNRLYVLSPDGDRIHVVGRTLFDALALDLAQLRSDQLFTIPVFEARALTLQASATGSARTRLRRDNTRWIFEAPITTRAAKTPVELLINDLNTLRVARFLPAESAPPPESTGLANPRFRLTLEGNSRRESLLLGLPAQAPAPGLPVELYARLDERPALFTVLVAPEILQTLDAAQTALRERRLLDLDPARVTSVTLQAPAAAAGEIRIQKLDATVPGAAPSWQLASPALATPLRAEPALVERLLRNLALLEAAAPDPTASPFHSDAPSRAELENLGFNLPARIVTLQLTALPAAPGAPLTSPTSVVLELASPGGADSRLYARVEGQPFIYSVASDTDNLFPVAPASWRERTIARLPEASRITRLVLRAVGAAPDAAPPLDYTPTEGTPPPAAVATLLGAVRELRARTFVRDNFPATVPVDGVEKPWAYVLEATLDPATDSPWTLHLAERTGGSTQLAGSARADLVFTLDQPVLDALWSLLYAAPAK